MEFKIDSVDYNVPEFFENFSYALPKIVRVSEGYCGDIIQDTFDRDQVLRIHTYSRQKRVIARKISEDQTTSDLFSIPLNYPTPLCVVKHNGKLNKERTLVHIVQDYQLPVNVQFSKNRTIAVGSRSISGDRFPQLQLTETFEEIYMLGNFIASGVLQLKPEVIPLYLSDMRLVEIIGFKDQGISRWKQYAEALTDQVTSSVTFDTSYGNENVAVYHPEAIRNDNLYSYIAPTAYANISAFLNTKHTSKHSEPADSQYESIAGSRSPPQSPEPQLKKYKKLPTTKPVSPPMVPKDEVSRKPPPVAPKPIVTTVRKEDEVPPAIPGRNPKIYEKPPADPPVNPYDNDIPRGEVHPTQQEKRPPTPPPPQTTPLPVSDVKQEEPTKDGSDTGSISSMKDGSVTSIGNKLSPEEIASLKIADLTEWLEKLKLSKYIPRFEEEMVDGNMLLHLDEETLREDFGMKRVECIRLQRFVEDGHVPT